MVAGRHKQKKKKKPVFTVSRMTNAQRGGGLLRGFFSYLFSYDFRRVKNRNNPFPDFKIGKDNVEKKKNVCM